MYNLYVGAVFTTVFCAYTNLYSNCNLQQFLEFSARIYARYNTHDINMIMDADHSHNPFHWGINLLGNSVTGASASFPYIHDGSTAPYRWRSFRNTVEIARNAMLDVHKLKSSSTTRGF